MKYPEPPRDATALPAPGFAADPSTYPQPTGPPPIIRHDVPLNGDWKDFCPDPSNATRMQIPVGLHHVAKPGSTKTNWALDMETLNGTGADKPTYFKMFARQGARLDINLCMKVFVNQPAFVTWAAETKDYGWSFCIFRIEMSVPNYKPVNLYARGSQVL